MQCAHVSVTFSDGSHIEVGEMLLREIPQEKPWQCKKKHKIYDHFTFFLIYVCTVLGLVQKQ